MISSAVLITYIILLLFISILHNLIYPPSKYKVVYSTTQYLIDTSLLSLSFCLSNHYYSIPSSTVICLIISTSIIFPPLINLSLSTITN